MFIKWPRYLIHAGVWIAFYLIPYLLAFKGRLDIHTIFSDRGALIHLISFIFLVIYSYGHYFWLVPKLYLRKRYLLYALSLIGCLIIITTIPQLFKPHRNILPHLPPPAEPNSILFGLNYNVMLFFSSTVVGLTVRQRIQLFLIEKEKMEANLSLLRAQINPHFLFNTLNCIYSLAIEKSDYTPTAIVQLSELMRYILKESSEDYIALDNELNYIRNYIALQKARFGDTVKIFCSLPEKRQTDRIAPLVLISFIENAFKHGVNPDEDSEISISASVQESKLEMLITNNKVESVQREEATGIGLKNAKARLEYLYPEKHLLHFDDNQQQFTVHLTIDLA